MSLKNGSSAQAELEQLNMLPKKLVQSTCVALITCCNPMNAY